MNWDAGAIDDLRRLWREGKTCNEIGVQIGFSRNAVIGKIHRLGLPGRRKATLTTEGKKRKIQERNASRVIRQRNYRANSKGERVEQTPVQPAPPFIGSLQIPFTELRDFKNCEPNQCRFIADEAPGPQYLACGNETLPGESWCGHCHEIVKPKPAAAQQLHPRKAA